MSTLITDKLILTESNLKEFGIWDNYNPLRELLYKAEQRRDCVLIQGSAFVVEGQAFLIMGVGGIDFLDSLAQLDGVDGIIGNGNALFLSADFRNVYSAHTTEELVRCYELEGSNTKHKFLEGASIAPLIFLLRSMHSLDEYEATKKKAGELMFETANTFAGNPVRFAGSLKSRLRGKFLATARVVHCARRPTLEYKECLFCSYDKVRTAIDKYRGYFALVYTLWSQEMCDAVGMRNTRKLAESYNPTDPITPHLLKMAKNFL